MEVFSKMVELIQILANTPLPTILIVVGFVTLSIGFGLKLKVIFDVERLNKMYAKIAGVVFLFIGIILELPIFHGKSILKSSILNDPFLKYYLICVPLVVIVLWIVLKFSPSEMQVSAIKRTVFFMGILVTASVIWRAIEIIFYISDPDIKNKPLGLYVRSTFWPYFILIGFGIIISTWIIYLYTKEQSQLENRSHIYRYFIKFCIYLATCRLVWEVLDWIARLKIPENQ